MERRSTAASLLVSLRPDQWHKNLIVFAALIFAVKLLDPAALARATAAFLIFCAVSSVVYLINDVADREQDRLHPVKRLRPIASGAVSPGMALTFAAVLGAVALGAAFFPVGQLADISNAGTLYAFMFVAIGLLVLRKKDADRKRHFRVPAAWVIAPLTIAGCVFLFFNLPTQAMLFLPIWGAIGLVIYFAYSRGHSHLGRGTIEVHEPEYADLEPDIPGAHDHGRP